MNTEEWCLFLAFTIGALAIVAYGVHELMPEMFSLASY